MCREVMYTHHSPSPSDNTLYYFSTASKLRNGHWYNPLSLPQFRHFTCTHLCVRTLVHNIYIIPCTFTNSVGVLTITTNKIKNCFITTRFPHVSLYSHTHLLPDPTSLNSVKHYYNFLNVIEMESYSTLPLGMDFFHST